MSGKYNKQHPERTRSNYPERLAARGLSKAPRMRDVDDLRRLQNRRLEQTGSPFPGGQYPFLRDDDREARAETEAILADPETMAAITEALAEEAA